MRMKSYQATIIITSYDAFPFAPLTSFSSFGLVLSPPSSPHRIPADLASSRNQEAFWNPGDSRAWQGYMVALAASRTLGTTCRCQRGLLLAYMLGYYTSGRRLIPQTFRLLGCFGHGNQGNSTFDPVQCLPLPRSA